MHKGGTMQSGGPQQGTYKQGGYQQQQPFFGGANFQQQCGGGENFQQYRGGGGNFRQQSSYSQRQQNNNGSFQQQCGGGLYQLQGGDSTGGPKFGTPMPHGVRTNPDAQQRPQLGPPNSTPNANGQSARCNRCGTNNHIQAPFCCECNLALLTTGYSKGGVPYPTEPPPGNHVLGQSFCQHVPHPQQGHRLQHNNNVQSNGASYQYNGYGGNSGYNTYDGNGCKNNQHVSGKGFSGGKGNPATKWCNQCGHPNKPFHNWCNSCHAQLPYTGKGGDSQLQPQAGVAQGSQVFLKGGQTYFPGGAKPGTLSTPGLQAPYALDPQQFAAETAKYPARIPRCFEVSFEMGQYVAPVNLAPIQMWKTNVEYLNHLKLMQSKIDNYKAFLHTVENKVITLGLPAWKHHKELEKSIPDLPDAAKGLHNPPLHIVAQVLGDQISNPGQKAQFDALMLDILNDQTPPTPRPCPASTMGDPAQEQLSDQGDFQDDCFMAPMDTVDLDESFEIPQWQGHPQGCEITDQAELDYLSFLQDGPTPCLPKRQRLHSKTPNNEAIMGRSNGKVAAQSKDAPSQPVGHSSDSDLDSMSKTEKKAELKRRKKAAQQQAATSSLSHSRKSINKPKQR